MKTTNLFRKILSAGLLLSLMIVVVMSCRKKDDTPQPDPIPLGPVQKDVFTDPKVKMMSDYEVSHNRSFQASGLYGNLIGIGPMDIFKAGYGIFSAIEKYRQQQEYQQEINHINASLNNIQTQLTQLETDFSDLSAELNYDMTELMNELYVLSNLEATAPIITAFSNADENGFRWYSDQAKSHNSGTAADSVYMATQVIPRMNAFMTDYTTGPNGTTLQNAIQLLNGYIIPSSTSSGLLKILSRNIVAQNSSADPMEQYMILENYFMQVANFQFQALVVQLNCFSNDSVDYQSFYAWFTQIFVPEIEQFQTATNFLAVSLYDYRNERQFNADISYINCGISSDTIVGSMMARSQFVANLMYEACGVPAPVMCSNIVLPHFYNPGTGQVPLGAFGLTVGGKTLTPRTDTLIASPFPYTYWEMNTQVFSPDNHWQIFNYGKYGTADAGWYCTPQAIQIMNPTWGSLADSKGQVTPLWYNPRDPRQTSTIKTDSCVVQFAFFCASWKWGFMGPCRAPITQRASSYLGTSDNVGTTSDQCQCPVDQPGTPFVRQFHNVQCKWESGGSANMTYGSGILQSIYSGTFDSYSGGQIYACDFYYWNATSSGSAGAGVSLFVNYNWNHTCQTGLKHYFFRIGDGINTDATCQQQLTTTPYNCNGSIVKSGLQSGSGFVLLNNLAAGTTYRLGMEVEMGVWETSQSYSFNMATNIYAQFTFNGKNTDY